MNLGQAVVVSLAPEVLAASQSADKAGRILAEVVAQDQNQVTLKTPQGNIVIKTDATLAPGQVVMLRLDAVQQQAKILAPIPQFIAPQIDQSAPAQGEYVVKLTPNVEAAQDAENALPQQNWRGQFLPADLPKEAADLIRFLQAVYRPGSASNQQNLPLPVTEGVTKLIVFTQLLQQMGRLPANVDPRFFFEGVPPENMTPDENQLLQSLQKMSAALMPTAQKAGEQAGQWLKSNVPPSVMGQLNQLGGMFNKAGSALSPLLQKAEAALQIPPGTGALQPVQMHMMPEGLTLLQAWQHILQNPNASPAPKAPFLLLNMLGIQRPGQDVVPLQKLLPQLFQENNKDGGKLSGNIQNIMPTVVLPGSTRETPLLMSPFGLLFSLPQNALAGKGPLLPGTIIFWSPVANPAVAPMQTDGAMPGLSLWPQKLPDGSIVGDVEWAELDKMWSNHLSGFNPLDPLMQQLIPNAAQPKTLNAVTVLLLQALNLNSVGAWLGDKTVEKLRDGGKQDMLARLVSDFAQMSSRSLDMPAGTDMQRFVLPMLLHEQMAKMVWQVKRDYPDGHQDNPDEKQRKYHTRTHFTIEVPTIRYGALEMKGMVWKHTLDLNLRTNTPLEEHMRNGIRERFKTALDITGYRGQIIFVD
ncbi:MAG TPA: hypothetical protein VGF14_05890 [Alphaproteobacteria bacterium]